MLTQTVDLKEAKNRFAELISRVVSGVEVILTDRDVPIARLSPVAAVSSPRIAGLHTGAFWVSDDFDAPLPEDFWVGRDETAS